MLVLVLVFEIAVFAVARVVVFEDVIRFPQRLPLLQKVRQLYWQVLPVDGNMSCCNHHCDYCDCGEIVGVAVVMAVCWVVVGIEMRAVAAFLFVVDAQTLFVGVSVVVPGYFLQQAYALVHETAQKESARNVYKNKC